jgi:hypothetical protein
MLGKRRHEEGLKWDTCIATPTEKTRQEMMIPILRPALSATGAAPKAPKMVPRDRIETTRDC